jgi:hypothetical protein
MNNIKQTAAKLEKYGRNGDTMLAHITPEEAQLLKSVGGSGTINPKTGLPEFFLGSLIGAGTSLLGGLFSGGKAADAEKQRAASLREAGERAAAMAQFKPMGMTTAFGSSQFTPEGQGSYTLSPQLQAIQRNLFGATGQYDPTQMGQMAQPLTGGAQSLFNLGQQYLATSPQEAAQQYMSQQQALLAPSREAGLSRVQTANFGRGTGGLGVQTGTGSAPSNPLAQAYFNQLGQQDLQLAAQADEAGMARARFGAGLFGTGGELLGQVPKLTTAGYGPLEAQLGLLGTTERLGQQPFMLSQDLAGRYSQAGAQAGRLFMEPQAAAANAYGQYQSYSPIGSALSSIGSTLGGGGAGGSWFSSLFSGGGGTPSYSGPSYGTNSSFNNSWFDTMSYD